MGGGGGGMGTWREERGAEMQLSCPVRRTVTGQNHVMFFLASAPAQAQQRSRPVRFTEPEAEEDRLQFKFLIPAKSINTGDRCCWNQCGNSHVLASLSVFMDLAVLPLGRVLCRLPPGASKTTF
ncbi:hypothetical protein BaRGS_00020254 [Batillaria attramentaria]|uniref:Uncharacterized protein n=1 Tax=Batillaria attramentaria TaxID=370345 RepID=A0ABD0KN44_9CAEN